MNTTTIIGPGIEGQCLRSVEWLMVQDQVIHVPGGEFAPKYTNECGPIIVEKFPNEPNAD